MHFEHATTQAIPADLVHQAGTCGLALPNLLDLIQRYGPLAIQILQEILTLLAKK